jgi:hypothetical protein
MAVKRNIRDMDKVYDNAGATCVYITAYVQSKGDLTANTISNDFCNIEVLECANLYYLVLTTGSIGGNTINVAVRRFNSKEYVKENYDIERKSRIEQGYRQVEVVTIYPNCSVAAQNYVAEHRLLDKKAANKVIKHADEKAVAKITNAKVAELKTTQPKLHPKVAELVENIYYEADMRIKESIDPHVLNAGDSQFGMLTQNTIKAGRKLLKEIAKVQNEMAAPKNKDKTAEYQSKLVQLSNAYNSTIPRVLTQTNWYFGDGACVLEQFDILDSMEILLSNAVLQRNKGVAINEKYNALNTDIQYVTDKKIIEQIKQKMRAEQLHGHNYKTRLLNVFEVKQKNAPAFDDSCGNVVSLFHGTGAANLCSILSTYIKLPQNLGSNVHITGRMFGAGVYFGQYSKSLQYSTRRFGGAKNKGSSYYLFICDVALGKMCLETYSKNYAHAPAGYNSVMGVGVDAIKDGCALLGVGGTKDFNISPNTLFRNVHKANLTLQHNEFIVYNQSRYRIRYIIEVADI